MNKSNNNNNNNNSKQKPEFQKRVFHISISSGNEYISLSKVQEVITCVKQDLFKVLKTPEFNLESWIKAKTQELIKNKTLNTNQSLIVRYTLANKQKRNKRVTQ